MECPHELKFAKIENDLYFGDARKPGLTTRAEKLEDRMDSVERSATSQDKKLNAILVLAITILGGMVGELLRH